MFYTKLKKVITFVIMAMFTLFILTIVSLSLNIITSGMELTKTGFEDSEHQITMIPKQEWLNSSKLDPLFDA